MMVSSSAATVEDYLAELTPEDRAVMIPLRELIVRHLPHGFQEVMNWGMITYEVPLSVYPHTYNKKPLAFVALAAQKNYFSLYLNAVYQDPEQEKLLRDGFAAAGKKLDMGKSCIRFRKLDQLPLDVIAQAIARTSLASFLAQYEAARENAGHSRSSGEV